MASKRGLIWDNLYAILELYRLNTVIYFKLYCTLDDLFSWGTNFVYNIYSMGEFQGPWKRSVGKSRDRIYSCFVQSCFVFHHAQTAFPPFM